jgi:hypothetical protein
MFQEDVMSTLHISHFIPITAWQKKKLELLPNRKEFLGEGGSELENLRYLCTICRERLVMQEEQGCPGVFFF